MEQLIGISGQKGTNYSFVAIEEFSGKRTYYFAVHSQTMTTTQLAYGFDNLPDDPMTPDMSSGKTLLYVEQYYCGGTGK